MEKQRVNYFIYFAVVAVNIICLDGGSTFTWASPVLPKLKSHDPNVNPLRKPLTNFEESWVASIVMIGAVIGPFAAGLLSDKLGKKKTLLLLAVPMTVSHMICAFATNVHLFLIARFMTGTGVGGLFSVIPNYVGEISEDKSRGMFGSFMGAILATGQIFCYVVGPLVSLRWFSVFNVATLMIFYVLFGFFVPETPYDLVKRNDQSGAEKSLMKLRNRTSAQVQKELIYITETVENDSADNGRVVDLFRSKSAVKALTICCGLMIFQQFSGICALLAYMQSIFEVSGASISPIYSTIIISTVSLGFNFTSSLLIDRMGRRLLLALSSSVGALCMITLGVYFYLRSTEMDTSSISWLPITSLIAFMISFNLGFANIPWIMLGELFPSSLSSSASTIVTCLCFLLAFLVTMSFPLMSSGLGEAASFWIFGAIMTIGHVFVLTVVPETKGKSFREIQDMLNGTKK